MTSTSRTATNTSRWRSSSTKAHRRAYRWLAGHRPSVLVIVSVAHPDLRWPLWLPLPSGLLYLGAWLLRLGVAVAWLAGPRVLRQLRLPMLGPVITQAAWGLLCSGGYDLLDLHVAEEAVHIRVRVV